MTKRDRKQLAQRIRQQTGIPLGAAGAIAVLLADYRQYELEDNPATKKYAKQVADYWPACSCCGPTFKVVVTGPKGQWEQ